MGKQTFKAQIDRIIINSEKRLNVLMKQSLFEVIEQMQKPTGKGGKMRVKTGFLRASGQSSLNGMPTGPSRPPAGAADGALFEPADVSPSVLATIGKLKPGATFYFGWTANYAKYREAYDGFRASALQNWQGIVTRNVEKIRKRFEK